MQDTFLLQHRGSFLFSALAIFSNKSNMGKCSLKNNLEIKATISGYANEIVHAKPDGIYVKAPNKNTDEKENIIPNTNNINNSFKDILKEVCLNNLSHKP